MTATCRYTATTWPDAINTLRGLSDVTDEAIEVAYPGWIAGTAEYVTDPLKYEFNISGVQAARASTGFCDSTASVDPDPRPCRGTAPVQVDIVGHQPGCRYSTATVG